LVIQILSMNFLLAAVCPFHLFLKEEATNMPVMVSNENIIHIFIRQ